MNLRQRLRNEDGASLVLAMAVLSLLGVFATSALAYIGAGTRGGSVAGARLAQLYAADAGMEHAIAVLAADPSVCAEGGASHTWPTIVVNARVVTFQCDWLSGGPEPTDGPRTVRAVSTAAGADGAASTTISATVVPDDGPVVSDWRVRGDWTSPGPSTTTSTSTTTTTTSTTSTTSPTSTTEPPSGTTTTTTSTSTTTTTIPTFSGSYFLKTSGSGDVAYSTPLPLSETAPTETTLYNYDTNRDAAAGLLIRKGSASATETNTSRFQEWSMPITVNTRINGNVSLVLWSSMKSFATNRRGIVAAHLRECDATGTTCTSVSRSVDRADWSGGSTTWVSSTFDFGNYSYTLTAGRTLRVKVTVESKSADDMWFAYDTVSLPSRLVFA